MTFAEQSAQDACPICGRIFYWSGKPPFPPVCMVCIRDEMSCAVVMERAAK